MKLYRKGSYGFVRYKNHPDAVRAIVGMNGQVRTSRETSTQLGSGWYGCTHGPAARGQNECVFCL